jgi:uncharacterized protein YoxC
MRLFRTVVASLTLHALLLLVPFGTAPFVSGSQFFSASPQRTARLLVTLKSENDASKNSFLAATESPNETNELSLSETLPIEEGKNKQSPVTGESAESMGIKPTADAPPRYYARNELDRPPRMADDISEKDGALDQALREVDEHGFVVLELWISDKGNVEKSEIVSTDLSKAVVSTVRDNFDLARFIPARLNKQAVHSRVTVEFLVKEKPRRQ